MKKLIFIILTAFTVFAVNAQDRTVSKDWSGKSYYKYTGATADVLNGSTIDTLDFVLNLYPDGVEARDLELYVKTAFTLVGTADTTITIQMLGKVCSDETYTLMTSTTFASSAAGTASLSTASINVYIFTADTTAKWHIGAAYGTYITNVKKSSTFQFYRYIKIRYIIAGNDHTGTGVKIKDIEFKRPD